MNKRLFLIPMQAPANGTGKGTRFDPWRPKYLGEMDLDYAMQNARHFCLAEVFGEDAKLDILSAKIDVVELKKDGIPLNEGELREAKEMLSFLGIDYKGEPINAAFIQKVQTTVLRMQQSHRPETLLLKVMEHRGARRG